MVRAAAFEFILAYLDVGYICCFVPFKIKSNHDGRYYVNVHPLWHKILTLIFHTVYTVYCGLWSSFSILEIKHAVFRVGQEVINIIYAFYFMHFFFLQTTKFSVLINLVQEYEEKFKKTQTTLRKVGTRLCIFLVFVGAGTLRMWMKSNKIQKVPAPGETLLGKHAIPDIVDEIFRCGLYLMFSLGRAVGESACLLLCGFGWYLKEITEDLKNSVGNCEISCLQILDEYLHVKRVNESIIAISKHIVFMYTVGSIPFVSEGLLNLTLSDPFVVIDLLYTGFGLVAAMVGSAEANNKGNELRYALLQRTQKQAKKSQEFKDDDPKLITLLVSEFSNPDIGLKGMHFFTVSYGLLGVMLSQCIVYALIILQMMPLKE